MKFWKTPGGTAREWEGESSRRRASTTPEWTHCPRVKKPPEWTTQARECQGRTDRGGEGT